MEARRTDGSAAEGFEARDDMSGRSSGGAAARREARGMQAGTVSDGGKGSAEPKGVGAAAGTQGGAWTVRALLAWMNPYLKERGVENPRVIAEILLAHVLGVERLRLYMQPGRELAAEELGTLRALVARAGRHEPVQFLVGRWPFLGRDLEVAPCTLIPRPSTEVLVERALAWYRERGGGAVRALDLCTGTGCIAISLALGMRAILRPEGAGCRPLQGRQAGEGPGAAPALPVLDLRADESAEPPRFDSASTSVGSGAGSTADSVERGFERVVMASASASNTADSAAGPDGRMISIVATDLVPEAVELARRNAARLGVEIDLRAGDLYRAIGLEEAPFDLIVANPPYVSDAEYAELDPNVAEYEPASALRGGADGLDLVRRVVAGAEPRLATDGLLAVEIGWKHRDAARALVSGACWRGTEVLQDQDGLDRVLVARRTDVPWKRAR